MNKDNLTDDELFDLLFDGDPDYDDSILTDTGRLTDNQDAYDDAVDSYLEREYYDSLYFEEIQDEDEDDDESEEDQDKDKDDE